MNRLELYHNCELVGFALFIPGMEHDIKRKTLHILLDNTVVDTLRPFELSKIGSN